MELCANANVDASASATTTQLSVVGTDSSRAHGRLDRVVPHSRSLAPGSVPPPTTHDLDQVGVVTRLFTVFKEKKSKLLNESLRLQAI